MENIKFPVISQKEQSQANFRLRTVSSMQDNLMESKLKEFYYTQDPLLDDAHTNLPTTPSTNTLPQLSRGRSLTNINTQNNFHNNQRSQTVKNNSNYNSVNNNTQQIRTNKTMGSTRENTFKQTFNTDKYKLTGMKTVQDKEQLLQELELAIDWDHYLVEKENIIDNVSEVISAAEV